MALESRRWRLHRIVSAMILTCSAVLPAAANEADGFHLGTDGRVRLRETVLTSFPLDGDGFEHDQRQFATALLRLRGYLLMPKEFQIHVGLQVLDGQFFGDESRVGGDAIQRPWRNTRVQSQLLLREMWLQVPVGIGVLRVGRMPSNWGLGLLANGGDEEASPFNDVTHGDIVNRAVLIARPLQPFKLGRASKALHLVLGADLVERDELTNREDGDRAWQVVGALLWREAKLDLGVYVAHRDLKRDNDATIKATAVDAYGKWRGDVTERYQLETAFEGAAIFGTTDEFRFDGAPKELDIRQFGLVARATLTDLGGPMDYRLELGFASGDNDAQDGTLRAFRFDPAYKASMILFDEVLGRASARGYDRVTDPGLSGTPPPGIERSPTQGAVTNAVYLAPVVGATGLDGKLRGMVGALFAFAPGDVVDPYAAATAGGFNRSAWGKSNAHGFLGWEGQLGAEFRVKHGKHVVASVGAQYGVFVPGAALKAGDGQQDPGVIHKLRLMTDLRW
ncbi:MAG: hypothetical protein R3F39_16720 [Myxococcota bacterium]